MKAPKLCHLDGLWAREAHELCQNHNSPTPSRAGEMASEQKVFAASLTAGSSRFMLNRKRHMSPSYAGGEALWMLTGSNDGNIMKHYSAIYDRICDAQMVATGAYGFELFNPRAWAEACGGFTDADFMMQAAAQLLGADPLTRRAYLPIFKPHHLASVAAIGHENKDVPCVASMQFLLRGHELDVFVNMRSNDWWLGAPYDVFTFSIFQLWMACVLGVEVGEYHHQVASCHLYNRHAGMTGAAIEEAKTSTELDRRIARFERDWAKLVTNTLAHAHGMPRHAFEGRRTTLGQLNAETELRHRLGTSVIRQDRERQITAAINHAAIYEQVARKQLNAFTSVNAWRDFIRSYLLSDGYSSMTTFEELTASRELTVWDTLLFMSCLRHFEAADRRSWWSTEHRAMFLRVLPAEIVDLHESNIWRAI